jgi:hypothetical protein
LQETDHVIKFAENFYIKAFRPCILNSKIGKRNLDEYLKEELKEGYNDVFKKQLLKLKKSASINKQSKYTVINKNCTIFDIPYLLWSIKSFDHFYFIGENTQQAQLR